MGLAWTFDTVAADYEKYRPGYAAKLYERIFAYAPIGAESCVLEVGSGAGQATEPILRTGCRLTAVEYGERFSAVLREKFGGFPKFSVITGKFEETSAEENSFDLIFSATAFHWIPEKEGYEKVYALLKEGGAFARFANHPFRAADQPALGAEIDVPTLEKPVKHRIPEGTQSGTTFRLKGQGIVSRKTGIKGDLILTVKVETPTKLSEKQKELLRELDASMTGREYEGRKSFADKIKDLFN